MLAGLFYGMSWYFILSAEKRIANLERTRHWKYYEPAFVRPQSVVERRYDR